MKGRIMSDDIQNITNKTENTLGQHIQQQEGDTTLSAIGWIRQKLRDFSTENIKPEILETENLLACRFLLIIGFVASAMIVGIEKLIYQKPSIEALVSLAGMAYLFALNIAYRAFVKRNSTLLLEIISLMLLALFAFYDTSAHPQTAVFIFPFILVILPPMILDSPWKLILLILISGLLAYYFNWYTESGQVFQENLIRLTGAIFVSCVLSWRMAYRRLRSYEIRESTKVIAEHDPLTGIYNRGGGTMMIRNCVDQHESGTFLIIDVDNFKHINDTYGHQQGDVILRSLADTLKTSFKGTDVVMRMGGDEFVVYSIGMVEYRVVCRRLEQLVDAIHHIMISEKDQEHVTVSIGGVINDGSYPSYDSLFRMADKYLYSIKEKGKDGFSVHDVSYRGLI